MIQFTLLSMRLNVWMVTLLAKQFKKHLAATKDLSLVTGTFTVDEKHNPVKSATVLEFVDGKQQFNSKVNP